MIHPNDVLPAGRANKFLEYQYDRTIMVYYTVDHDQRVNDIMIYVSPAGKEDTGWPEYFWDKAQAHHDMMLQFERENGGKRFEYAGPEDAA